MVGRPGNRRHPASACPLRPTRGGGRCRTSTGSTSSTGAAGNGCSASSTRSPATSPRRRTPCRRRTSGPGSAGRRCAGTTTRRRGCGSWRAGSRSAGGAACAAGPAPTCGTAPTRACPARTPPRWRWSPRCAGCPRHSAPPSPCYYLIGMPVAEVARETGRPGGHRQGPTVPGAGRARRAARRLWTWEEAADA